MVDKKQFTEDELFSFARYIWAKPMSDYSKGLIHYFTEWKEMKFGEKKPRESTLENPPTILGGRMRGNTTRLVDHAIQLLYEGKRVIVHDSWEWGKHREANRHLFDQILRRFQLEHAHDAKRLVVDRKIFELELE